MKKGKDKIEDIVIVDEEVPKVNLSYREEESVFVKFNIELMRHDMKKRVFFKNVIRGFINQDVDLFKFITKIKTEEKVQSKTQSKKIMKEVQKSQELVELFSMGELDENEIEEIFSILEKELEFG